MTRHVNHVQSQHDISSSAHIAIRYTDNMASSLYIVFVVLGAVLGQFEGEPEARPEGTANLYELCGFEGFNQRPCAAGLKCAAGECHFADCFEQKKYAAQFGASSTVSESLYSLDFKFREDALRHPELACNEDGTYKPTACEDDGCLCISVEGYILGVFDKTKEELNCACNLDPKRRLCANDNGDYSAIQCETDMTKRSCFCVDRATGEKVDEITVEMANVKELKCYDEYEHSWMIMM